MDDINSVKIDQSGFVLAVSGGVDSMVLLDLVRKQIPAKEFVVAHFNHGIRVPSESAKDTKLISDYCDEHGITLEVGEGNLGQGASEAEARKARYKFFDTVKSNYDYNTVITAHHQDDQLETAIINLLRGTGYRGLSAIRDDDKISRPLLRIKKDSILEYASRNNIKWNEDVTNADQAYLRNYVRHTILPKLAKDHRLEEFEEIINQAAPLKSEIESLAKSVEKMIVNRSNNKIEIDRKAFILLDHKIAQEIVMEILKSNDYAKQPERRLVDKIVVFIKTAQNNAKYDLSKHSNLQVSGDTVSLNIRNL